VKVMRRLVASYFRVMLRTMQDLVPKVAMRYVVLHVEAKLHGHLISNLLRCDARTASACWLLRDCALLHVDAALCTVQT
jgi:Dynamin GTPase effector domain